MSGKRAIFPPRSPGHRAAGSSECSGERSRIPQHADSICSGGMRSPVTFRYSITHQAIASRVRLQSSSISGFCWSCRIGSVSCGDDPQPRRIPRFEDHPMDRTNKLLCPKCGASMKSAKGVRIGRTIKCPKCQAPFTVRPEDAEQAASVNAARLLLILSVALLYMSGGASWPTTASRSTVPNTARPGSKPVSKTACRRGRRSVHYSAAGPADDGARECRTAAKSTTP